MGAARRRDGTARTIGSQACGFSGHAARWNLVVACGQLQRKPRDFRSHLESSSMRSRIPPRYDPISRACGEQTIARLLRPCRRRRSAVPRGSPLRVRVCRRSPPAPRAGQRELTVDALSVVKIKSQAVRDARSARHARRRARRHRRRDRYERPRAHDRLSHHRSRKSRAFDRRRQGFSRDRHRLRQHDRHGSPESAHAAAGEARGLRRIGRRSPSASSC